MPGTFLSASWEADFVRLSLCLSLLQDRPSLPHLGSCLAAYCDSSFQKMVPKPGFWQLQSFLSSVPGLVLAPPVANLLSHFILSTLSLPV